jgi:hypothetical protein
VLRKLSTVRNLYTEGFHDASNHYANVRQRRNDADYIKYLWQQYATDLKDCMERGWDSDFGWLLANIRELKRMGEIPDDADESFCEDRNRSSSNPSSSKPSQEQGT